MGHALAAAGYVVAVPEYRRAGMADEGWAGTFDDIALGAGEVGAIAGAHGADLGTSIWAHGADLGTSIWAGHSAGGHLAVWAAARPGLPGRVTVAGAGACHPRGIPGGLRLPAAVRGMEPGRGRRR